MKNKTNTNANTICPIAAVIRNNTHFKKNRKKLVKIHRVMGGNVGIYKLKCDSLHVYLNL